MLPRECDNDNCDYEADSNGRGRWVHVKECAGPVDFLGLAGTVRTDDEYSAYLLG